MKYSYNLASGNYCTVSLWKHQAVDYCTKHSEWTGKICRLSLLLYLYVQLAINNLNHGKEWNTTIYQHESRKARVMINRVISRVTVV